MEIFGARELDVGLVMAEGEGGGNVLLTDRELVTEVNQPPPYNVSVHYMECAAMLMEGCRGIQHSEHAATKVEQVVFWKV
jgi:hypothetical protein